MKKFLVIAAAAGALAVGVPAAIAATDSAETPAATFQPVQQEQQPDEAQPRERPNGEDCPEKAGRGGGGDNSGSSATPSPEL